MKRGRIAQAATRAKGRTAENEATPTPYNNPATNARPRTETILLERKLQWIFGTLNNPRIRMAERRCLLLVGGEVLLDYLSRQALEEVV